jgi:hypothetical protein
MTTIADTKAEQAAVGEFLDHIMKGVGPTNACYAVGWTPRHLRKKMQDPDFVELVRVAQERKIESLEEKTYELAMKGNLAALQFFLLCQAPERGWRPPQQRVAINQQTTIRVENVEAAKAAILDRLAARDVKALQPAKVIDVDLTD